MDGRAGESSRCITVALDSPKERTLMTNGALLICTGPQASMLGGGGGVLGFRPPLLRVTKF